MLAKAGGEIWREIAQSTHVWFLFPPKTVSHAVSAYEEEHFGLYASPLTMTTMKLKSQLADVDKAFAGARIRSGTISAGYSHVIPSHPMPKKVLKTKRKTAAATPAFLSPWLEEWVAAVKATMARDMPAA